MSFWNDAKEKVLQAMKPRQQDGRGYTSNRADGSVSAYVPKMKSNDGNQGQTGFRQTGFGQGGAGFTNMFPEGVDPNAFQPFQPTGGATGQMPPHQPQQGMPQQNPFGNTAYQQTPPRPQAQYQGQNGQGFQHGFGQNAQQGQNGFTSRQGAVPPQQPVQPQGPFQQQSAAPQQTDPHTFAFPGGDSYVVDGNAYKMVLRVAQITGVPSCFRVIEFMYNNEAVIVNAEQITDLVEADRCMDLIFGAACAMKQRLMRVSGKQIYVITPPQVYVAPFDSLRRAGMADIERRWPGAMQANMQSQPVVNNVQPMQPMGNPQPMQQMYGQPRQDDFAGGMGRRAARNAMHTNGYTDYGGFGAKGR